MNKIRINELARELEVKAHEIIDRLPELGVTEKKTHSSSIDEDVAIKLRQLLTGVAREGYAEPEPHSAAPAEEASPAVETLPVREAAPSVPQDHTPAPVAIEEEKVPEPAAAKPMPERPAGRPSLPIRPPLAGSSPGGHQPSPGPAAPRIAPTPLPPPTHVIAPGRPIPPPARPVPSPRPGQVLSGPRQSMPGRSEERR